MGMEATIRELADKEAIRSILCRFCIAADRFDLATWLDIFHPDAIMDGPHDPITPDQFAGGLAQLRNRNDRMVHAISTMDIVIEGDTAKSEAYFRHSFILKQPDEQGRALIRQAQGLYADRFERRDGKWGIIHRMTTVIIDETRPLG